MRDINFIVLDREGFVQVDLLFKDRSALVTSICKACGRVYQVEEGSVYPLDREHPHDAEVVGREKARRDDEERLFRDLLKGPSV